MVVDWDIKNSGDAQRVFGNFIDSIIEEHGDYYTLDHIRETLADFNGNYNVIVSKNGNIRKHYIRFGSPAELTAFLLRYS